MSERAQDMIAWMAQMTHQAHHEEGAWQLCPKALCRSAARWIRENPPHDGLPCKHCEKEPKEHTYGKCLFEPTHYQEMTKHEHVTWLAGELTKPRFHNWDLTNSQLAAPSDAETTRLLRAYDAVTKWRHG